MRRFWCLLLVASAGAQTPGVQQHIADRLTASGLRADVSFLASDALQGRGTPSPGLEIAGEYIAAQFRRAGLEPAGGDGYFQNAPYNLVTPNPDGLQFTLAIGGSEVRAEADAVVIHEPVALDLKRAGAILMSLTDTEALAALTPEEARGKVLFLEGSVNPAYAGRLLTPLANRLQPAVLVFLPANGRPGRPAPVIREVTGKEPVPIVSIWSQELRKALEGKSGAIAATVSAHIAAPAIEPARQRNVIGLLRGSDPQLADTYVVLTAHYDHLGVRPTGEGDRIFNGANDDASGVACVIEIANTLASLPARPKRSVVFMAMYGEELGLVGTRYYARHPVFPLAATVADLNLEQVGRTDDITGPRAGILNLTGFDYTSFAPTLQKAGEEFGIQLQKDERASDTFFNRSDNQAFADAGVPAHTASVGYEFPDYHRVTDEWPKLDYDNMAKVARTVALALFRTADSVDAPIWNTANPKTAPYVKAREGTPK
jgi:hypothetical protein